MRRPAGGFSLISLMVGMTLSLLSVLAMLSLYRNMVGISVRSIQDSRQDGQIAAALLTAQQEMSNAGFWISGTPDASFKLLANAALSNGSLSGSARTLSGTASTGNALIWSYKTANTATASCAGLLVQDGKLSRLQGASGCTSTSQWNSTTWSASPLIEANQPADFFTVVQAACWPFNKATSPISTLRIKVTLNAVTSSVDASNSASTTTYVKSTSDVCLPNLVPGT